MAEYRPYLMRLSSRSLVEPNFIRLILTGDEVRFPSRALTGGSNCCSSGSIQTRRSPIPRSETAGTSSGSTIPPGPRCARTPCAG